MNASLENLQKILGLNDFQMLCLKQDLLFTAQDFIDHPNEELRIILGMRTNAIQLLKDRIISYFTENLHGGRNFLVSCRIEGEAITTGIPSFDNLFASNGIYNGEIIEIIGPPAAGKTMLLYSIIINVLLTAGDGFKVIFINTKRDFRAMKLKNMMEARGISLEQQRSLLESITIYSCNSPEQLAIDLQLIHNRPQSLGEVKMVFIDSITIPFYQYFENFGNSMFSLSLMSEVVQSLKLIADRHVPVSSFNYVRKKLLIFLFRQSSLTCRYTERLIRKSQANHPGNHRQRKTRKKSYHL